MTLFLATFALSTLFGTHIAEFNIDIPSSLSDVDTYVEEVMARYEIPGVSLAIIKDDELIHRNYYGYANLEHEVPISDASIFRVYSLTKLFVATGAFQLIEEGKLSLEDSVSTYVPDLPDEWQGIQVKHLLAHSSGLPDMAPIPEFQDLSEREAIAKVLSQKTKFKPGELFDYNQTGFWLLKEIIEQITETPLADHIFSNQFDAPADTAFFSSDSRDIIQDRVTAYFPFVKGHRTIDHPYLQGDYAYAMNGLNITMEEFIKWSNKLNDDELIEKETKEQMWLSFPYAKSNKVFGYSWDKHNLNGHTSYGFSGSMVTAYRTFPEKDLSIIFLGTGMGKWFDIEDIINHISSLIDRDLYEINTLAFETFLSAAQRQDFAHFERAYAAFKKQYPGKEPNYENAINKVGYRLLDLNEIERAIRVFEFNNQEFPNSWNTYDSLAEALEMNGQKDEALQNYSKALELNTQNAMNYNPQIRAKIERLREH